MRQPETDLPPTRPPAPRCSFRLLRCATPALVAGLTVVLAAAVPGDTPSTHPIGVGHGAPLWDGPGPLAPIEGLPARSDTIDGACPDGPESLSLPEAWGRSRGLEPGYRAAQARRVGEEAAAAAVAREWLPYVAVDAIGDQGQRLSPGEERVLGPGLRGELRLLGGWVLMDSGRGARRGLARESGVRADADGALYDQTHRAGVARGYLALARAEAIRDLLLEQYQEMQALEDLVDHRIREGVDGEWEAAFVGEGVARVERELAQAEAELGAARVRLSRFTGICVTPQWSAHRMPLPPVGDSTGVWAEEELRGALLRAEARVQEAQAGIAAAQDRWRLELVGGVGPNYSRAFDDGRVEQEYLVGLAGSWRPDLAGFRSQRARAEGARARAATAEAESRAMEARREAEGLDASLSRARERSEGLRRELLQAQRAEEIAGLRWREGVGSWSDLLDSRQRLHDTRLQTVELHYEVGLQLLELAEWGGRLDHFPGWLYGEEER